MVRASICDREQHEEIAAGAPDEKSAAPAVTYADLALKFLYWPNAQVVGRTTVRTRNCWKLRLQAPSKIPLLKPAALGRSGERRG